MLTWRGYASPHFGDCGEAVKSVDRDVLLWWSMTIAKASYGTYIHILKHMHVRVIISTVIIIQELLNICFIAVYLTIAYSVM